MDSSSSGKGLVLAVGLGPGAVDMMTPMAAKAIERSEVVAGYSRYVERIEPLLRGKRLIATGMTKERERCEAALDEAAKGRVVAMVCSGDAGVYGMAGLLLELVESVPGYAGIEIESVPGVTAATAAAAVLGAPLMNDFAIISLSDLMTPAELIVKRLEAVAGADMVVALYNPRSHSRRELMDKALEIFMGKLGPDGVFGLVRNAFGLGQTSLCGKLSELPKEQVDMSSS
jgi:precorrin-3B C17-methyltransferase